MAIAAEHPNAAMGPKNPIAPQKAALVPHQAQRAAQVFAILVLLGPFSTSSCRYHAGVTGLAAAHTVGELLTLMGLSTGDS